MTALTNAESPGFEWIFGGQVISNADTCYLVWPASDTGSTTIPVLTVTDLFGCSAQTGGTSIIISEPDPLLIMPTWTNPSGNLENGTVELSISGGTPTYSVLWDNGFTTPSLTNLGPGTYCATVTDARGCTDTLCVTLSASVAVEEIMEHSLKIAPNPATVGQWVTAVFPERFAGQEIIMEILDLQGRTLLRQMVQLEHSAARLLLPENVVAGTVIIRSIGENGLNAIGRLTVR